MQKHQWRKMGAVREVASVAIVQGEVQKGGHSRSTEREEESPLCNIDGHLSISKVWI